jgi:putative hydrolase of the HAD superfamily
LKGRGIELEEIISKLKALDDRMNFERRYDRNSWWPLLLRELDLDVELPVEMLDELTLLFWDKFAEYSKPYPDAWPVLRYLKRKGYKIGVVTDTDGKEGFKHKRVARSELAKFFDVVVVGGEDTTRTKPDPQPFLSAAKKLEVKPGECVVVGDKTFTDIRGGKAAGMRTILVERRNWGIEEAPDFKVGSLSEIRQIL